MLGRALIVPLLQGWVAMVVLVISSAVDGAESWKSQLVKKGKLDSPLVEVTPFVFKGRLYMLDNWQKQWEFPGSPDGSRFQEDQVRIRDVEADKIVSIALVGHGLGMALVCNDRVYVFAGDWGQEKKWGIREIHMTCSDDLKHWAEPVTVLKANPDERFFNVSVCRGDGRFVMLVETNDPKWPSFTFKYFTSDDLRQWKQAPKAIYGRKKYVGGPALYYEGGYYYTLYLQSLGHGRYETRVTRSKNLVHWQDAPQERPFVTFNPDNRVHPLRPKHIRESNASDAELVYWKGKTIVYFTGGDQRLAGDLQWAQFDGTPRELLEHFFEPPQEDRQPPKHEGDWTPVLIPAEGVDMTSGVPAASNGPSRVVPSPQQLAYQNSQLGAFVHFGPATYIKSNMLSTPDPEIFNPMDLDVQQWVRVAKSFGAKHIVLTAKHHNGFCLWPTKTTEYCVRSSPWKNGRGDVVGELADACRKHGLPLGIYISGGDKHYGCFSTPDPIGKRKLVGDRNAYFHYFMEQLNEVLTNYGDVAVVWFDGAYDPFGLDVLDPKTGKAIGPAHRDAIAALVRDLQPGAVMFGGAKMDIRWSGSEQGWAPYPLWNVIRKGEGPKIFLSPDEQGWFIAEANIHTRSTWFWTPDSDQTLKSVDQMMQAYYNSIGRGANLLVNLTPDTRGLIPEVEVKRMADFGAELHRRFGRPIAATDSSKGWSWPGVLELDLGKTQTIDHVVLEEDIAKGQHVLAYAIDLLVGGQWKTLAQGQSIGRRRIEQFDSINAERIRLRVLKASAATSIRAMTAYRTTGK